MVQSSYIHTKYRESAKRYLLSLPSFMKEASSFGDLDHVYFLTSSVLLARDRIVPESSGGGFVQAVIKNDLRGAFHKADEDARKALRFIILAFDNCSVNY